jgi:hypothetical protein
MFRLFGAFLIFVVGTIIGFVYLFAAIGDKVAKPVKSRQRNSIALMAHTMKNNRIIVSIISKVAGQSAHKLAVNVNG